MRQVEIEGKRQLENHNVNFNLTNKLVNGRLMVYQGIIVGCSGGTFENLVATAKIVEGKSIGNGDYSLSVYPASQPVFAELISNHSIEKLINAGTVVRTAFCGPCFGAGDTPANNALSIRHATRNFPNREGSKPDNSQIASVALMDARSIAATAVNGGLLTPATEINYVETPVDYKFDKQSYMSRVYQGFGQAKEATSLKYGPGIANWPKIRPLPDNLLIKLVSVIHDPVTTTDELIPSGETSSYRSNPFKLAEFTLSRKDPAYVGKAKAIQQLEAQRHKLIEEQSSLQELESTFRAIFLAGTLNTTELQELIRHTGLGSVIFAIKPGDGSAREQAASCQRVLGETQILLSSMQLSGIAAM